MTLLESIEDVLAGQLNSVLPSGTRVITPRQSHDTTGARTSVLVAYRDSEYSRDLCFRKRVSRFTVQFDAPEDDLHLLMQSSLNGLDRYEPLVDMNPIDQLRIISDVVERKDGMIYGIQVYEIDIIG